MESTASLYSTFFIFTDFLLSAVPEEEKYYSKWINWERQPNDETDEIMVFVVKKHIAYIMRTCRKNAKFVPCKGIHLECMMLKNVVALWRVCRPICGF